MRWIHTTGVPQIILCSLICLLGLGVGAALGGPGESPAQRGLPARHV